jgi:hypothetical protein
MTSMSTPEQPLLTAAINALKTALSSVYTDNMVQREMEAALPVIATYSTTTLERISVHSWNHQSASQVAFKMEGNVWTETIVNDYMAVSADLGRIEGVSDSQVKFWHLHPGLHAFNNDGDYPKERLSQLTALFRITDSLQAKDWGSTHLADSRLWALVLCPEAPYRRDDIVGVITVHNEYDVDRIKAMLDHGSPALRSGVL